MYLTGRDGQEYWVDEEDLILAQRASHNRSSGGGLSCGGQAILFVAIGVIALFILGFIGGVFDDGQGGGGSQINVPAVAMGGSPEEFAAPYPGEYYVTQDLHGHSYGHLAVDLGAGKGSPMVSPINGTVTQVDVDQYGNTTLVIENERYRVLMLHGNWTVRVGDRLSIGDSVGTEGNIGYTMDAYGRLCYPTRDCGYHVHLNVWDQNGNLLNPLKLID